MHPMNVSAKVEVLASPVPELIGGSQKWGVLTMPTLFPHPSQNKKLSYCWETVRRESMPRVAEMDVEMTT